MRNHDEMLEFERLFAPRGAHGRFEPNTDVHLDENDRTIVVHVELAGADARKRYCIATRRYPERVPPVIPC